MKFNWGHGLTTFIALGIIGILTLVYFTTRERIDLVTEDYYPKELKYEDQIAKIKNYQALKEKITLEESDVLWMHFPPMVQVSADISGTIHIYRPSDKDKDMTFPVSLNEDFKQVLPMKGLPRGKYEISVDWQANDQAYFYKQTYFLSE